MPQPISSNSSQNLTAYDPSEDRSRAEDGAGGASGAANHSGSEGAASVLASSATFQQEPSCVSELLGAAGSCGAALLLSRMPTPGTLFAGLSCANNGFDLLTCATGGKSKSEAP